MDVRISRIFTRFSRILELQIRKNRVKIREIRTYITHRLIKIRENPPNSLEI
jgi:hypothetical protein